MSVQFEMPLCGCLSCHEPAVAIIDHPDHGRRAVCPTHAKTYPVVETL